MNILDLFKDLFKKLVSPVPSRPFSSDSWSTPRGHANSKFTKSAHRDSRVKRSKTRLSHMQIKARARSRR